MHVLKWIIDRCEGRAGANESPIGFIPQREDLGLVGADHVHDSQLGELLSVKRDEWEKELEGQAKFFETLKPDMPERLLAEREKVVKRFGG
jgi:phosphoenolpyruvate carboxykinase (GTP)